MTTPLPPNPCLVAIILVIRTRAGPKVVYHYPSTPSFSTASSSRNPAWYGSSGNFTDPSDTSDSELSSDSDTAQRGEDGSSKAGSRSSAGHGSGKRDAAGSIRSARARDTGTVFSNEDLDEEMPERSGEKHDRNLNRDSQRRDGKNGNHDHGEPAWDSIFGFGTDGLGKLLAPGKPFNKRRFEFGIDQLVFLGAPRFVREDGLWKKKRRAKRYEHGEKHQDKPSDEALNGTSRPHSSRNPSMSSFIEPEPRNSEEFEEVPIYGAAYGHVISNTPSEINSESRSASTNENTPEVDLTMFNVVFVMNPPALEYSIRVQEMYDNVVKKFAKALKYAQAYNSYVYQESRGILAMKEKGREKNTPLAVLWSNIAQHSSLARAIMVTFNTISDDKIAHINLGQDFDASFQLPQPISISGVPTPTEPQMPGLWLTTATPWEDDEPDTLLSPHSALLLLEDDDVLLKEVESDAKELSGPLSYFVRNLTSEKSLLKLSHKSSLSINDVQLLARHLIYWRRGRAIPPLRQRDTYIVSPNADMRKMKVAIPDFASRFPTLPSLPTILNQLSGTPRAWFTYFPSRDHRDTYMRILAWLMRHGWVTQLRTFGWVRVSPEVKATVAFRLETEKRTPRSGEQSVEIRSSPFVGASDRSIDSSGTIRGASNSPFRRHQSDDLTVTSPHISNGRANSVASDTTSVSSGQTAVTVVPPIVPPFSPLSRPNNAPQLPGPTNLSIRHSPYQNTIDTSIVNDIASPALSAIPSHLDSPLERPSSSTASAHDANTYTASIIHSPQKASALELRWIEQIGSVFCSQDDDDDHDHDGNDQGSVTGVAMTERQRGASIVSSKAGEKITCAEKEAKELWPVLLKYFDGKHAFEEIYVREGLKKKRVAAVLGWLSQAGWLLTVRHW
jgi:hypothetical protein